MITLTTLKRAKKIDKGFVEMNMTFHKNKPYIKANTWFNQSESIATKYLIDTGAALATLIHNNSHPKLSLPKEAVTGNLAVGLGGELKGYLARVKKIAFEPFEFEDIVSNFQEVNLAMDTSFLNGRNGIIGNQILSRFDIIINYPLEKLYLKANRKFKKKFEFDKSGLVLFANGNKLTKITVFDVLPNSPAKEVGIQKNDVLKKINGMPVALVSLGDINNILKKREGKKIKIVLKRGETRIKCRFKLRQII